MKSNSSSLCQRRHKLYTWRMTDPELLELAASLAERAGVVINQIRARGFETTSKADFSPVTEADHAAELLIAAGLRQATPDIPVVAEEEVAAGRITARAECFWLVDPIDGTREFSAGRDDFAVCIGLIRNGKPVLGVIGQPAIGAIFGGLVGVGAWRRDGAGQHAIKARTRPVAGIEVVASRSYANDPTLAKYLADFTVAGVKNMGSALKFSLLAQGQADLYPRFGRTMEWDTAAAQAVLEAAGGQVLAHPAMVPLSYGKPGYENPHFVCHGAGWAN